jgi:hypothetical protein
LPGRWQESRQEQEAGRKRQEAGGRRQDGRRAARCSIPSAMIVVAVVEAATD